MSSAGDTIVDIVPVSKEKKTKN